MIERLIKVVMKNCLSLLLFLIMPIWGCDAMNTEPNIAMEKIYNFLIENNTIKVQVVSFGCTNKASLTLVWQENTLTINRLKKDHCRRMPFKKWFTFELPENVDSFTLTNPILLGNVKVQQ